MKIIALILSFSLALLMWAVTPTRGANQENEKVIPSNPLIPQKLTREDASKIAGIYLDTTRITVYGGLVFCGKEEAKLIVIKVRDNINHKKYNLMIAWKDEKILKAWTVEVQQGPLGEGDLWI